MISPLMRLMAPILQRSIDRKRVSVKILQRRKAPSPKPRQRQSGSGLLAAYAKAAGPKR